MSATRKPRKLGRGLAGLIDDPVRVEPIQTTPGQTTPVPVEPAGATPAPVEPAASEPTQPPADARPAPAEPAEAGPASEAGPSAGLLVLPIASIYPNRYQPRRHFDEAQLAALADSIKAQGLLQPVVVRPGQKAGGFELIAGERRWRAARLAGLSSIPAIVREASDQVAAELALVENVQREDLNPIDRARALRRLLEEFGLTQAQVGQRVGLDRSSVANLIRLTELEPALQEMVATGLLSQGHAKALLAAPAGDGRLRIAELAAREQWSVRATEQAVRDQASGRTVPAKPAGANGLGGPNGLGGQEAKSPELLDLERRLGEHLGTKVRVQIDGSGTRGQLVIQFFDLDHFDGLMDKLGYSPA